MIIWINGTYCVGKTEVSNRLKERLSDYDAELLELDNYSNSIMKMILENSSISHCSYPDIQFYEEFRRMIEKKLDKMLIIDTAITDNLCKNIVFNSLKAKGYDLLHIILSADETEIKRRIQNDNKRTKEGKLFALTNLKNNMSYMNENFSKSAVWIKTDDKEVESIVDEIIGLLGSRNK